VALSIRFDRPRHGSSIPIEHFNTWHEDWMLKALRDLGDELMRSADFIETLLQ
jgi:hypothetical protein